MSGSQAFSKWVRYCGTRRWAAGFPEPSSSWLSAGELAELHRLGDGQRRGQWLQGRRVAKELLAVAGGRPLAEIEILTRDDAGRGVAPQVLFAGEAAPWRLSLSHTRRGVLAAVVPQAAGRLGADLTSAAPDSAGFRRMWFTAAEQAWISPNPQSRTAQLWALKEAIYKACNAGEPWMPRAIEVLPCAGNAWDVSYHGRPLVGLESRLQVIDRQTAAVVYLPCAPATMSHETRHFSTLCL